MEQLDIYREWLTQISYRPNWTMQIVDIDEKIGAGSGALHIVARVEDTCASDHQEIEVTHRFALTEQQLNNQQFIDFVLSSVIEAETHEAKEWFLLNNQRIFDPHAVRS